MSGIRLGRKVPNVRAAEPLYGKTKEVFIMPDLGVRDETHARGDFGLRGLTGLALWRRGRDRLSKSHLRKAAETWSLPGTCLCNPGTRRVVEERLPGLPSATNAW